MGPHDIGQRPLVPDPGSTEASRTWSVSFHSSVMSTIVPESAGAAPSALDPPDSKDVVPDASPHWAPLLAVLREAAHFPLLRRIFTYYACKGSRYFIHDRYAAPSCLVSLVCVCLLVTVLFLTPSRFSPCIICPALTPRAVKMRTWTWESCSASCTVSASCRSGWITRASLLISKYAQRTGLKHIFSIVRRSCINGTLFFFSTAAVPVNVGCVCVCLCVCLCWQSSSQGDAGTVAGFDMTRLCNWQVGRGCVLVGCCE